MRAFTEAAAAGLICPLSIASGVHKTCCGLECAAFTETGGDLLNEFVEEAALCGRAVYDTGIIQLYYCGMARARI